MSSTRPKRQATINKSYNDTLDESYFEEQPSSPTSISSTSSTGKRKYTKKVQTPNDVKTSTNDSNTNKHALSYNWQPPPLPVDYFSNKLNLSDAYIDLKNVTLYCPYQSPIPMSYDIIRRRKSKEIFQLKKGDYIYMVSEPPGEPYYIGRIMGFTLKNNSKEKSSQSGDAEDSIVDAKEYVFQIQWFYRPRDISKSTSDSRLLYASMHSDTCPLSSFRGNVNVRHKQDIEDEYESQNPHESKKSSSPQSLTGLEAYTQQPNAFYFDKLFDRYMIKFYDILSTSSLLKLSTSDNSTSRNFLVALNKRFEYIFVESQRAKSMIEGFSSNSRNCEKCGQWCSSQDSVNCAECKKFYHMLCLDPPLYKKPSRGFSWSCASCTKKHEIEYRSKKMLMLSHDNKSSNANEITTEISKISTSQDTSSEPEEEEESVPSSVLPKYELMAIDFLDKDKNLSFEERRLKEEWSMRYLGMYTRLEDGVDLEDRSPYPRASTRLGSKHQATNIPEVYDRNIVYYDLDKPKAANGKKKSVNNKKPTNGKSKAKEEQDTVKLEVPEQYQDIPIDEYPQWLQPRPKGYIERGVDDGEGITSTLLWKNRDDDEILDSYIQKCSPIAEKLKLSPNSPNFMDEILKIYMKHSRNEDEAFAEASKMTRKTLKEPTFTKEEVNRFELGVKKYGSELYPVYKEVKTQPCSMIVRFYYIWKKTKNGRLIWGNYEGRRQKKPLNLTIEEEGFSAAQETKKNLHDGLNDSEDDSSYENDKIISREKHFTCKHCNTNHSIKWFKITGNESHNEEGEGENTIETMNGLCFRCARIWRRYAVVWEDPNEVEKKNNKPASGWKKKIEFELLRDSNFILDEADAKGGGLSYEKDTLISSSVELPKGKRSGSRSSVSSSSNLTINEQPTTKRTAAAKDEPPAKKKKLNTSTNNENAVKKEVAASSKSKDSGKKNDVKNKVASKPGRNPGKAKAANSEVVSSDSKASKVKKTSTTEKPAKKVVTKEKEAKITKLTKSKKLDSGRKSEVGIKVKKDDIESEKAPTLQQTSNPTRRQKKNSLALTNKIINPIFNSNYLPPDIGPTTKIDKKSIPIITKEILNDIVGNFRKRQLTDLTQQLQSLQVPHLSSISLPFDTNDRKCCVCREHDTAKMSTSNMLICSHCGVNVHNSCVGISIPPQVSRPIKEWLCEVCINDLKPHHSTLYSCSLCLANESNYELSILGSPMVRPDFLKPIFESGKWCHLLCAMFNYNLVDFKQIPQINTRRLLKDEVTDQKTIIESMQNLISIESISKIYLKNYTSKCGICNSFNGSLMVCHICESLGYENEKFHVTCAQDTPNFKLGFKLDSQSLNDKDSKLTKIGSMYGKLKPILVCPKHDQSSATIYSMRTLGSRMFGVNKDDLKPLVQLFLEDIVKATILTKFTGAQFKASRYIESCKIFEEEEAKVNSHKSFLKLFNSANKMGISNHNEQKACERCITTASPMWWIKNLSQTTNEPDRYLCQSCYHICDKKTDNEEYKVELEDMSESLVELLQTPLIGENYGIADENDKLAEIVKSDFNSEKNDISKEVRSHISIGDILS